MKSMHVAASGLVIFLVAGCASEPNMPSAQQQVISLLKSAYHRTTAVGTVAADVNETLESGTDPAATGKGTATLEFAQRTGETQLTVDGRTTVFAVRMKGTLFEGKTQLSLKGKAQDLVQEGRTDPKMMPEVQAPGIDPFQLTTLLGAVDFSDSVESAEPVVSEDSSGKHTRYQVTVSTAKLALHEPAADRAWLTAISHQPRGDLLTLDATIAGGRVSNLYARLPVPQTLPANITKEKVTQCSTGPSGLSHCVPASLPTPPPLNIVISDAFSYGKRPPAVSPPS